MAPTSTGKKVQHVAAPAKASDAKAVEEAEKQLTQVQESLEGFLRSLGQNGHQHTNAMKSRQQSIAEKREDFRSKCGSVLNLRVEDYFCDVVDRILIQKPVEENIMKAFEAVLLQEPSDKPESEDDFKLVLSVLDLIAAFFQAYSQSLDTKPPKNLPGCGDVVKALASHIYNSIQWGDKRMATLLHGFHCTGLLHNLMMFKSLEAVVVFVNVWERVDELLDDLQNKQRKTSITTENYEKFTKVQKDLFRFLRTEELLWHHLGEHKSASCYYFTLNRALSRKGLEGHATITLALLGHLCQPGKDESKDSGLATRPSAVQMIRAEVLDDGSMALW